MCLGLSILLPASSATAGAKRSNSTDSRLSVVGTGGVPSASPHTLTTTAIPLPVQEALTVVATSRDSGPLTVDSTAGSVDSGVYSSSTENQSVGVSQHWSLMASDSSGIIILGIMVTDSGVEAVSGWVPGASQDSNWVFNTSNASPAATFQVTVPGTTFTIGEPTTSQAMSFSSKARSPHIVGTCTGIVATPYTYGPSIYYGGTVYCNIPAAISDLIQLWDLYNYSTPELIATAYSFGTSLDYPQGTAVCNVGYAPRNVFHGSMTTNITWPPVSVPPTAFEFTLSPLVGLPCNQ